MDNEEERRDRNEANIAWLQETFDAAKSQNSAGVMLVMQANIFEGDTAQPSGFAEFRDALRRETIAFGKPVVLDHGDSHFFRIDKPLYTEEGSRVLNFTLVETFGDKDVHWVRSTVDTRAPEVFYFRSEIVEENVTP
jgi:hypothetical protein